MPSPLAVYGPDLGRWQALRDDGDPFGWTCLLGLNQSFAHTTSRQELLWQCPGCADVQEMRRPRGLSQARPQEPVMF